MLRNVTDICNSFLTQAGASQAHGTTMPRKGVNVHSANWSSTRVYFHKVLNLDTVISHKY